MKDIIKSLNQKMFLLTREEREYVQYTLELEQILSALEEHLHESNDPEEVVRNALVTACQFYGGDWAGFLDIDLDLNLWTPYMWYNTNPNDRTNQLLGEFESSDFLYRWVAAMKENRPLMVPDCDAVKDTYPHEYEIYQRLEMHSVIAVSVKPFPTGFLVVRNPTRHINQSSMLQMLAFVIIKGVSEKQMLDSAKQAWSPDDITNNNDIIINLFGGMEIYTSKGIVRESELKSPKISKLLTYLLLHPTRIVPPREIAETIWPDEASEQENPGQNMKHLIYRLRQHFLLLLDEQIVESTAYGYRLNPKLHIMSDIQQFDRYKEAAFGTASVISKVEFLKKALSLYKGPVLTSAAGDHWLLPVATHYSLEYREFAEKWLPFHVRKERLSPNTYDSYRQNLDNHILPYFGDMVMSQITVEAVDDFLDYLSRKPCKGAKSYGKSPDQIPTLSSSSIKKCYIVLTAGFPTALLWGYIKEIPKTTAPAEKTKKRRAWSPDQVAKILDHVKDDKLLHLAIHIGFVCSLREGEVAGIDLKTIDLKESSLWIIRQVQRVSDAALKEIPKDELLKVFPKKVANSKSSLILKKPKTDGSHRKQYITTPLVHEIAERIQQIQRCKDFFQEEYQDHGLLICQPDGTPLDPCYLVRGFRKCQQEMGIPEEERIDFQGLRKSGQMHKVRLTQNNYQLVADNAGQSPEVLMHNYNEALDTEKRALAKMVEASFYPGQLNQGLADDDKAIVLQKLQQNPELVQQLLQGLLNDAVHAQRSA